MANILLSNRAISPDQLAHQCSIASDEIYDDQNTGIVLANRPYLINKQPSRADLAILATLRNARKNKHLAEVALAMGEDNILAIAEIMKPVNEQTTEYIGTATGVYSSRMSGFQGAVQRYQNALLLYRDSIKSGATKASQQGAKQIALNAYKIMQQKFQLELGIISNHTRARKGTALSNPTRGTNIARSGRNAAQLNISSQTQAHNLVNFSKYARHLGNGLVVLDFSSRIGNVHNSYRAGGNWEREMFIESTSFVGSTAIGTATVGIGASALSFLMLATPVGWVGLILGGAVIAGTATYTSYKTNSYIKVNSGKQYDELMNWLTK